MTENSPIGKPFSSVRRTTVLLVAAAWLLSAGCTPSPPGPPDPSAIEAETFVEQRILEATEAVESDPASVEAWGRLGEIYDIHGFGEQATPCYERAVELAPEEWRWFYFAGIVLRESDPGAALAPFERAVELKPDYAPLHFYLGQGYLETEDQERAEQHFEKASSLDPSLANAWIGLARVALARDEPEAAVEHLQQASRIAPAEAAVHHHLARVYELLGQSDGAAREELLAESSSIAVQAGELASLPDPVRDDLILREGVSSKWLLQNGRRLLAEGQPARALESVERALTADPDSVVALLEYAQLLTAQGDLVQARQRVDRALEIDPESGATHAQLGNLLARSGDVEGAIREFETAIGIDPALVEAQNNLAALLFEVGRTDEGTERLRAAAEALPASVDVQYNFAAVLVMGDQRDEAIDVLRSTLELRPDYTPALYLLGSVLAMQDRFEEAVALFVQVLQREPGKLEARLDLGRALWELGRYAESVTSLREARQLAPNDSEVARELGWALATCPQDDLRDGGQALAIARRLCEQTNYGNPLLLDVLAAAQAESEDFTGAFATMRRAIQIVERTMEARGVPGSPETRDMQELLRQLRERAALYQSGRPYRQRP